MFVSQDRNSFDSKSLKLIKTNGNTIQVVNRTVLTVTGLIKRNVFAWIYEYSLLISLSVVTLSLKEPILPIEIIWYH